MFQEEILKNIITYWTPFATKADFAKAFSRPHFDIFDVILSKNPSANNLMHICHFLGDLNPNFLYGVSGSPPYTNGDSFEDRYNIPQGEQQLAICINTVGSILSKPTISIYRYSGNIELFKKEVTGFTLATTLRYGQGIKTKIIYLDKNGVTGNIMKKFNGEFIAPTRQHQMVLFFGSVGATTDESCFLVMLAIKDKKDKLIGLVKLEDREGWNYAEEAEFKAEWGSKANFLAEFTFFGKLGMSGLKVLTQLFKKIYKSQIEEIQEVVRSYLEDKPEDSDSWWLRGKIKDEKGKDVFN